MSVSINNQKDLIVNSLRVIQDDGSLEDINTVISNTAAQISGNLSEDSIQTIEALSAALDNDPNYFSNTATAIAAKQNLITGAATSITTADLTPNRAIVSTAGGKIGYSNTTLDQIGHLSTLSSDVQVQINSKAPIISPSFLGDVQIGGNLYADTTGKKIVCRTIEAPPSNNLQLNGIVVVGSVLNAPTINGTTLEISGVDITTTLAPKNNPVFTGTVSGISQAMVGLTNVNNTADADKPISTLTQTALNLKAPIANPTFTGTVSGITKSMVGLNNVDNTSDINKPISTLTQVALNTKANATDVYSKAEVDLTISNIIDNAPEVLNTLNELAAALNDDANYATTIQNQMATKADKVETALLTASGNTVYQTINSAFRIAFNSLTNTISLEYFDNDGAITTDTWVSLGEFIFNTETNTSSFKITNIESADISNNIYLNDHVIISGNCGFNGATNSATGDFTIDGDLTVGGTNIITALSGKQQQLINGTIPANTARVYVSGGSKIRSINGDTTINVNEINDAYLTIGVNSSTVNKTFVGLGDVDNTSDLSKPISTLTQAALDDKASNASLTSGLSSKQDTLLFTQPSGGSSLINGLNVKGIREGNHIIRTDDGATITLSLNTTTLSNDFYTQTATNTLLAGKANTSDVYTQAATDTLLSAKANTSSTFTKSTSGNVIYCDFNTKFRLAWDDVLNKFQAQYYDDEGALQTDGWGALLDVTLNTDTNIMSLSTSDIQCDSLSVNGTSISPTSAVGWSSGSATYHYIDSGTHSLIFRTNSPVNAAYIYGTGVPAKTGSLELAYKCYMANGCEVTGGSVAANTIQAYNDTKLTCNDNLTVTGDLTVNGSVKIFHVAAKIIGIGTPSVAFNRGRSTTCSVSRVTTGNYIITFDTHPDGANYIIQLTSHNGNPLVIRSWADGTYPTSTAIKVVTYKSTDWTVEDSNFMVTIY